VVEYELKSVVRSKEIDGPHLFQGTVKELLLKNKDACTLATSRFFSLHDPIKDKTPQDSFFKVWLHPS
jgi:hypothetical protein